MTSSVSLLNTDCCVILLMCIVTKCSTFVFSTYVYIPPMHVKTLLFCLTRLLFQRYFRGLRMHTNIIVTGFHRCFSVRYVQQSFGV